MIRYRVRNSPTLDPTVVLHLCKIQFIIILAPTPAISQVASVPEDIQSTIFMNFANQVLLACYILSASHSDSFNHPNNTELRTQITVVLICSAFIPH